MTRCYFCKKEFEEGEEYETPEIYQIDAFKTGGNLSMHKECRQHWEKNRVPIIPEELKSHD